MLVDEIGMILTQSVCWMTESSAGARWQNVATSLAGIGRGNPAPTRNNRVECSAARFACLFSEVSAKRLAGSAPRQRATAHLLLMPMRAMPSFAAWLPACTLCIGHSALLQTRHNGLFSCHISRQNALLC
uniref:Uncharacterized protein n=1 Tax=Chrysotila carterae TaxID=13221 RepID=A0A7S4BYG7_CHRCT